MSMDNISASRRITRDMDEPNIMREIDRLTQIESKLAEAARPDGTPRTADEISQQGLAIYRAMSRYEFCQGLEGALEGLADGIKEYTRL